MSMRSFNNSADRLTDRVTYQKVTAVGGELWGTLGLITPIHASWGVFDNLCIISVHNLNRGICHQLYCMPNQNCEKKKKQKKKPYIQVTMFNSPVEFLLTVGTHMKRSLHCTGIFLPTKRFSFKRYAFFFLINISISSKPIRLFLIKIILWVDPSQQPAEMTRRHLHRFAQLH